MIFLITPLPESNELLKSPTVFFIFNKIVAKIPLFNTSIKSELLKVLIRFCIISLIFFILPDTIFAILSNMFEKSFTLN